MAASPLNVEIIMNQHSIQEAYLKLFRDSVTGKIWVYPKDGRGKFQKPTSWCTAEPDFQSELLERAQNRIVETPGIQALRRLLESDALSETEYQLVHQWTVLHIFRNLKMRVALKQSGRHYEREFSEEFEKELFFSKSYYKFVHPYTCTGSNFFVTCDHPVIEMVSSGSMARFLVVSPRKLVQFSSRDGILVHNEEKFEDFVNSMMWNVAIAHVFSHSGDVDTGRFKVIADKWGAEAVLSTDRVAMRIPDGGLPNRFSHQGRTRRGYSKSKV